MSLKLCSTIVMDLQLRLISDCCTFPGYVGNRVTAGGAYNPAVQTPRDVLSRGDKAQ